MITDRAFRLQRKVLLEEGETQVQSCLPLLFQETYLTHVTALAESANAVDLVPRWVKTIPLLQNG